MNRALSKVVYAVLAGVVVASSSCQSPTDAVGLPAQQHSPAIPFPDSITKASGLPPRYADSSTVVLGDTLAIGQIGAFPNYGFSSSDADHRALLRARYVEPASTASARFRWRNVHWFSGFRAPGRPQSCGAPTEPRRRCSVRRCSKRDWHRCHRDMGRSHSPRRLDPRGPLRCSARRSHRERSRLPLRGGGLYLDKSTQAPASITDCSR